MVTTEVVEDYLLRSGTAYDAVGDGMWVLHDDADSVDNIVITFSPPLVIFRVKLMSLPGDVGAQTKLFRKLLELNATDMVSGAYGLEGDAVVASEILQAESLDFNEFQAAVDGLTMSITEHYPALRAFHERKPTNEGA